MGSPEIVEYPETIHFYGQVLPRVLVLSTPQISNIRWKIPERNLFMRLLVAVNHSKIHVEIHCSRFAPDDLPVFYKCAFDVARTAVELVAFKKGLGVQIEFLQFVGPDGIGTTLGYQSYPNLSRICTVYDLALGFEDAWAAIQSNTHVFGALNDLIAAITIPHVAPTNCARAVEGLRNVISGSTKGGKDDWAKMREMLRVDERYLTFVTDLSKDHRHGNRVFIDGPRITIALERSWTVMNRFLEYSKRAAGALPEAEFELLKG